MSRHPHPRHPVLRFARRFAVGRGGAAAVEFAMVALPFIALIAAVIEVGMIFLVSTTLEDATNYAARQVRIGALQTQSTTATAAAFQATICQRMAWLGNGCTSNLEVDVRTFSQFDGVTMTTPITSGVLQPQSALQFQLGGPGDIVLVRAYYPWHLFTPGLDGMTSQTSAGQVLITAATTFRNEPYPTTS